MTTTLKELENRFEDHVSDTHWDLKNDMESIRKDIDSLYQVKLEYEAMSDKYAKLLERVEELEKVLGVRE